MTRHRLELEVLLFLQVMRLAVCWVRICWLKFLLAVTALLKMACGPS